MGKAHRQADADRAAMHCHADRSLGDLALLLACRYWSDSAFVPHRDSKVDAHTQSVQRGGKISSILLYIPF